MKDAIHEQLITARRQQILEAAAKVFAQKGYHPATIRDIAREAGIADGTIYNYFENKTALLIGIFDRMRETIAPPDDLAALTAEAAVHTLIRAYLGFALAGLKADGLELFQIVISEILVNRDLRGLYYTRIMEPTLAAAEQLLTYLAAQGRIKPPHIPLTARAISGAVMGLMLERIMGDQTLESMWDALPDMLTDLILNGMLNGIKE